MTAPSPLSPCAIVAALVALLGAEAVVGEPARMAGYLNEPRRRFHTGAAAVALPRSVAQVQAIARWAHDQRVPLIPQGGNTGLVGGQVPLSGTEVIVSLTRLDAVREIDAVGNTMTLEAGVTLEDARAHAEGADRLFPLFIASQGSARIGGILASNAGGVQVLAHGNARDLCLGVEAVLADGSLYRGLNALKKNNSGYDLKNLLVGSEGTLGLITAATLKLVPRPAAHETAIVNVAGPEAALELFNGLLERAGPALTAFEIMPRIGIDFQLTHAMLATDPTADRSDWYALIEISVPRGGAGVLQSALEDALATGGITNAVIADSEAQRAQMWLAREQMSAVQSKEGASIKHDVSVPVARVPELIARGVAAVAEIDPLIRPVPFGHLGDGNIHFNFSQPAGADPAAFMAGAASIHAAIYRIVAELGGSISAEHGIGQLKTGLLESIKDPVALAMMRAIKAALDPHGILNPGKVLR